MFLKQLLQRQWILAASAGLLLVGGSSLWRIAIEPAAPADDAPGLTPAVSALPQDPKIQVFFNQSEASVYTDPYRKIERYGDDLEQVIVTAIENANTSIDVAVQALNLPLVAQALVARHQAGVQVRVILENQYLNPTDAAEQTEQTAAWMAIADSNRDGNLTLAEIDQANALSLLKKAGVPLIDDTADGSKGSGLMHHKFVVVDNQQVITGSANFTLSGIHGDGNNPSSRGNVNALLTINERAIAEKFTDEFNLMWGDGPGGQPDSRFGLSKPQRPAQNFNLASSDSSSGHSSPQSSLILQFSPHPNSQPWEESTNGLIATTLSKAQQSVDLALFVFSEQRLANQLESRVNSGVSLRALVDASFVYRSYSEALDLLGVTLPSQSCRIEANNRPWPNPIEAVGTPKLPPGDKLHHKFALIDANTSGATVIIGSQNWSPAANTRNDETLLVIKSPTVAAHFSREIKRLHADAYLGATPSLQAKIEDRQRLCL